MIKRHQKILSELSQAYDKLTDEQKLGADGLEIAKKLEEIILEARLYQLAEEVGISPKEGFEAIYKVLLGKDHGPRAAKLLLSLPKDEVIKRLKQIK